MKKITPFLWFDNSAEEAIHFYVDTFNAAPGSSHNSKVINIQRYPEGYSEGPMAGMAGKVLTGLFELDGGQFMALDGGPIFKFNESVSFFVECDGQEEVDYFWVKLTANGGEESMCGWLKDKYGLSWQIIPKQFEEMMGNSQPEETKRVMDALLKMKKIIVADLEKARLG